MNSWARIFLLATALFTAPAVASPLILQDQTYLLSDYGILIHDPDAKMDAAAALAYARTGGTPVKRKLNGGRYWLVTEIYNPGSTNTWSLGLHNLFFSNMALFIFDRDQEIAHYQAGREARANAAQRSSEIGFFYPLEIGAGERRSVVLLVETTVILKILAYIHPPDKAANFNVTRQTLAFTALGMLLALLLYNLFLGAALRDLNYAWYSLQALCALFYYSSALGLLAAIFALPDKNCYVHLSAMLGAQLFLALFARDRHVAFTACCRDFFLATQFSTRRVFSLWLEPAHRHALIRRAVDV
jgi:hypothetical protein